MFMMDCTQDFCLQINEIIYVFNTLEIIRVTECSSLPGAALVYAYGPTLTVPFSLSKCPCLLYTSDAADECVNV